MKTTTRWATVSTAAAVLFAGSAMGDLQGLDFQVAGVNHISGAQAPAGDHYTVDVYALVGVGDRLDAVAGDSNVDKMVSALPTGSFWQHPFGANDSAGINPALIGTFPSLAYDSFVTIGLLDSTDNALSTQGIDFGAFATGGDIFSTNGAWYVTPVDAQGEHVTITGSDCSDTAAVLVARLTVNGLDTVIHLEALFQGSDAGGATWQTSGSIDIAYAPITDCNGNGVADNCDIADGTSGDGNENGIPDECETIDCNGNGVNDSDDIADGTSSDCNGNAIPDECDIADGTSSDCDGNGQPDECQSNDCNGNGVPDNCDIADGTSEDCDGDGTPDECEPDSDGNGIIDDCEVPPNYVNIDQGNAPYEYFADAIGGADDGDRIDGLASAVNVENELDFSDTCVSFSVDGDVYTSADVYLAGCGSMEVNGTADFFGSVYSGSDGTARIEVPNGNLGLFGDVIVRNGATIETDCDYGTDVGSLHLRPNSMFTATSGLTASNVTMYAGAMIDAPTLSASGQSTLFTAQGTIVSDVYQYTQMNVIDDLMQVGDLYNDGTIDIWRGVYYVIGDVTNNGTINGDIDGGPGRRGGDESGDAQPGDGLNVSGNYNAGSDARLTKPHPYWAVRIGGHINLAINESANFHMSLAELHATGRAGNVQEIEVMGTDLGNTEDGLVQGAAGNFPLGTLRIDANTTARLVDTHDNDTIGQDAGEAFYCDTLVVDGYLDTNGFKVYANEIVINGAVSNDDDVVIINPPTPGDLNGDSSVDVLDLLLVIADWGSCPAEGCSNADLNSDGVIDVLDLLIILQEWS
jgi:hypothetical protein